MAKRTPVTPNEMPQTTADGPMPEVQEIAAPVVTSPPIPKSKTALTLGLGIVLGASVAALGYGAALKFPLFSAEQAALQAGALADLSAKMQTIDAAALDTAALQLRIAAIESAPAVTVDTTALEARIAALELKLASAPPNTDVRAELAEIRARLAQSDPAPAIKAAIAAQMGTVEKTAQDMVAQVSEAASKAAKLSAMTLLQAALDTGAPYTAAAVAIVLPDALAAHAKTGIPSLTQLRDTFPDAARAGLDAALKTNMGATWSERVTNFLRSQTGARALTAREGSDPDAVLSRIDAALNATDLPAVLAEIAALPQPAQTAMQVWINQAKVRADALAAFSNLTKEGM